MHNGDYQHRTQIMSVRNVIIYSEILFSLLTKSLVHTPVRVNTTEILTRLRITVAPMKFLEFDPLTQSSSEHEIMLNTAITTIRLIILISILCEYVCIFKVHQKYFNSM